jgi:hypothetical protein
MLINPASNLQDKHLGFSFFITDIHVRALWQDPDGMFIYILTHAYLTIKI